MKKILLVAFLAIISTAPAYAAGVRGGGGHGGGGHYGGGHGGGWGLGGSWIFPALIGGAIGYDLANPYYPYYSYPVYQQPYPIYAPSVAPSSVQYWYFCPAANAYYPYVPSCPTEWQLVPAMPPR